MQEENKNIEIGRDVALKFDFYFTALIFTVLGLVLQTASFGNKWEQYVFEILAWVFLVASGFAALARLEWMPVGFKHNGYLQVEQGRLEAIKRGLEGEPVVKSETGEEWQPEELASAKKELETSAGVRKLVIEKVEKRLTMKYRIQLIGFRGGIICLILSRGILHSLSILQGWIAPQLVEASLCFERNEVISRFQ